MNENMYTIWYMYCMDAYETGNTTYEQLEHVVVLLEVLLRIYLAIPKTLSFSYLRSGKCRCNEQNSFASLERTNEFHAT
jgi:hypothetical protein